MASQAHNARLGPYNSERQIEFLDGFYDTLVPNEDTHYIIVWDNVRFHHSVAVREWFEAHARCTMVFLPPYSPFLNPIEELFSSRRWKVYDRRPYERVTLLQAMEEACEDIQDAACQAWIRPRKTVFSPDVWRGKIFVATSMRTCGRKEMIDMIIHEDSCLVAHQTDSVYIFTHYAIN